MGEFVHACERERVKKGFKKGTREKGKNGEGEWGETKKVGLKGLRFGSFFNRENIYY